MNQVKARPTPAVDVLGPRGQEEPIDQQRFRSQIGELLYVARMSRPDIAFAVGQLARHQTDPGEAHGRAVKRLYAYLSGTRDFALFYGAQGGDLEDPLVVYTDSDFAGEVVSSRSTDGFVAFYGGGPIAWRSKLQGSTAQSTTEAELTALGVGCQEGLFLVELFRELGEGDHKLQLYSDNQSALAAVQADVYSGKLKHIRVRVAAVRELVQGGAVRTTYVPSESNPADIFTKPLGRLKLQELLMLYHQGGVK